MPDLVTVERFATEFKAHAAAVHLAEHEIESVVSDAATNAYLPVGGFAGIAVRLSVAREDMTRARELLAAFFEEEARAALPPYEEADSIEDDDERCLQCSADFPDDADACPSCGWTFG